MSLQEQEGSGVIRLAVELKYQQPFPRIADSIFKWHFEMNIYTPGCWNFFLTGWQLEVANESPLCPCQIFPRDVACMSTMMTFEYLSQLCQNKEQVYPFCAAKDPAGECCCHLEVNTDRWSLPHSCVPIQFQFEFCLLEVLHTGMFGWTCF